MLFATSFLSSTVSLIASTAIAQHDEPVDHNIPAEIVTHTDRIPIYGHEHTICAVANGLWTDPAVWDREHIPSADDAVCVPAGLTVYVAGGGCSAECLDLVIAGKLHGLPGVSIRARTITVLPAGHLELHDRGQVTFRDMPLDTAYDPGQYGHGLLVINGALTIKGQPKTTWATLASEVKAGDTTLTLAQAPQGWKPGDVLVLPDTRQPATPADLADENRHIEHAMVASVEGDTVTLAAPVEHDHLGWRNQQGVAELLPDVGNVSRSIVLESENPTGTRAHLLFTGRSDVTARYAELRELGRTTVAPLDNTSRDTEGAVTHVGTNQIGRYPWHFHHCLGPLDSPKPYQFEATGLAVRGSPKWGIAVHGSHWGYVGHCVVDGAKGAGIVTETVHEYASVIENNMIVGRQGSGERIVARAASNDPLGDFWHSGVGLGLASASCTIRGNRIYDCKEGIGMAGFRTKGPEWPAFRGADPMHDRAPKRFVSPYYYPFDFPTENNLVWGCWQGIEIWSADAYPDKVDMFPGLVLVHNHHGTDFELMAETTTKRWRFLGDFSKLDGTKPAAAGPTALFFVTYDEFGHQHYDCEYRGYPVGYRMFDPLEYTRFFNCTFECEYPVWQPFGEKTKRGWGWEGLWQDCVFLPVNGVRRFIAGDYPKYGIDLYLMKNRTDPDRQFLNPVSYKIRPWHDGRDLNVYHSWQTAAYAKPPIEAPDWYGDFPPGVYSNAQLIELGKPIFGSVIPEGAEQFGNQFFFAAEAE